jgi:hypothetical protein
VPVDRQWFESISLVRSDPSIQLWTLSMV